MLNNLACDVSHRFYIASIPIEKWEGEGVLEEGRVCVCVCVCGCGGGGGVVVIHLRQGS